MQGPVSGRDYRWESYSGSDVDIRRSDDASLLTIRGHDVSSTLIRCHWSPPETTGGRYVYSGSACGSIFIFDAITGRIAHELRGHENVVRDCSWHPSEQRLASVSWDGSVREWCAQLPACSPL
jgi:WD repeat-containing protein 23